VADQVIVNPVVAAITVSPVVPSLTVASPGPAGPPGIQGPAGPPGGNYSFSQAIPSATWNITHNLGFNPSVSVVDSANSIVEGQVTYINTNSLSVSFSAAFSGSAFLS
jgi:hypothetical protein